MKNIFRLAAVGLVLCAAGFAGVATVSAHADLESSDPAAGAVLAASPATVTLTFVEEIQKIAGSYALDVENAAGQSVTAGNPSVGSDETTLSVSLKSNLPDGVYTVHWTNTSADDGDELSEEFSFTVGAAGDTHEPAATPVPHGHDDDDHAAGPADDHHAVGAADGDHHATADAEPPTTAFLVANVVPQNDSNVGGRIEVFPAEGGDMTEVGVYLTGLAAGSSHKAHIHVAATCFEGAHAADLDTIAASEAGFGSSVTAVEQPFSKIANGNHVVLVHAGSGSGAADEKVIACGIIPAQPEAHDGHTTIALPSTGTADGRSNDFAVSAMLAALVAVGTMFVAGGVATASKRR